MAMVMRVFKWIKRVWRRVTCWVLFWRQRAKASILERSGFKKYAVKGVEKTPKEFETVKLVEPPREEKLPGVDECPEMPEMPEAFVLASTMEETELELTHHEGLSLLRLPRSAVQSVSTLMLSALQSGWQLCKWKSSVSSASVTSQLRTQSPLDTPEAEMLREVYLVLWAIRKQLRQLARRQERRRRHRQHHIRSFSSAQHDPVMGLRQDARSPL